MSKKTKPIQPKVLIVIIFIQVGASFAGFYAAKKLHNICDVTVLDAKSYIEVIILNQLTPQIISVLYGNKKYSEICIPFSEIPLFKKVKVIVGKVLNIKIS